MAITLNGTTGITTPALDSEGNLEYSGTLTGGTGVINIGSGQVVKDASGNVMIGGTTPTQPLDVNGNVAITGTARRITGNFTASPLSDRVFFQCNTANGNTSVGAISNGTGTSTNLAAFGGSDPNNAQILLMGLTSGGVANISSTFVGTPSSGTFLPLTFFVGGPERVRIDTSGNVGIGTSSPTLKLTVNGDAFINNTGSATTRFLMRNSTTGGVSGGLDIKQDGLNALINNVSSGSMVFFTNNAERARIDASGNLLVGTTSQIASGKTSILVTPGVNNGIGFRPATNALYNSLVFHNSASVQVGSVVHDNVQTVFATSSDYRLKTDVQPMTHAVERLMQLEPVNYAWLADGSRSDGFLAHEAQAVVPQAVTGQKDAVDKDGKPQYQGIDQSKLVPLLTAAIQEQQTLIQALTARIEALEQA